MKRLALALLVYVLAVLAAYGQNASGTGTIVGRVSPALRLSLSQRPGPSNDSGLSLVASADQLDSMLVLLSSTGADAPAQLALPLEIRTNIAYEMTLTLISSEGCAPAVNASLTSFRVSGTGVATGAAAVSQAKDSIDLMSCRNPVTALLGPRVSAGGNFTSPGNALTTSLTLAVPENVTSRCPWRVLFRVSLHPSF